jgi:hypothetical protein
MLWSHISNFEAKISPTFGGRLTAHAGHTKNRPGPHDQVRCAWLDFFSGGDIIISDRHAVGPEGPEFHVCVKN